MEEGFRARSYDLPEGDITGPITFEGHKHVIHLAGMLGTHELFDTIWDAINTNVWGTANVLEATRKAGAGYTGISMPAVFPSIYTATKIGARGIETAYHHTFGLPVSRVRAFNAYGPGQKYGPGHPQKILPTFARAAWDGKPIPIWGDGEQTVDLVHVDDLAYLLVRAMEFGGNETFDGGTGVAMTVNEVAELILFITGSKAGVEHLPMRRGEVPTKIVAEGEGWAKLNWTPRFSFGKFADAVRSYK